MSPSEVILPGSWALGWVRTHSGGRGDCPEVDIVEEIPEEGSGNVVCT